MARSRSPVTGMGRSSQSPMADFWPGAVPDWSGTLRAMIARERRLEIAAKRAILEMLGAPPFEGNVPLPCFVARAGAGAGLAGSEPLAGAGLAVPFPPAAGGALEARFQAARMRFMDATGITSLADVTRETLARAGGLDAWLPADWQPQMDNHPPVEATEGPGVGAGVVGVGGDGGVGVVAGGVGVGGAGGVGVGVGAGPVDDSQAGVWVSDFPWP